MKKLLVIVAALCLLCTALFALSACGDGSEGDSNGEAPHEHNYAKEVTEPNCTEQGYTTYTCLCGNSYIGDYVEALGHTEVVDEAKAPTCTATGLTAGKHCFVCEAILEAQTVVDALGHSEGAVVVENNIAPDCVNAGSYDNVVYCTVCSAELSREKVTIDALGHTAGTAVRENEISATCTKEGSYDEVVYCTVCSAELSREPKIIEKIAHTASGATIENMVFPTCAKEGSFDEVVKCSVCLVEISRTTKLIDKTTNHTPYATKENEVASTCAKAGSYDEVVCCYLCGYEISRKTVTVAALPHTVVIDEAKAPTCTETGLTAGKHCLVCAGVLEAQSVVDALGHTEVVDEAVAPTCTETGLTEGKHCSVCGEVLEAQSVVDALGHDYETTITPHASKENVITITYTCTNCNSSYSEEFIANDFTVTSSNRAEIGYTGASGENLVIPSIFQSGDKWYRVTSIGYDAFYYCTGLTSVTIGNGVTSIGGSAFYGCKSLMSVVIPDSVTSIGSSAFYDCDGLKSVYITDIAAWCGISFGNSYANPLYYAKKLNFNGELVTNLIIPDSVTSIGNYAFSSCTDLTSVTIPDSVTSIGPHAFNGCTGLTSIAIPDSVTSIGDLAFYSCDGLTSVTIGNGVTSIGSWAFDGCYKLVEVINHSSLNIKAGSSSNGYVGYYAIEVHTGESKIVNFNDYLFYTYNGVNYLLDYVGGDTALVLPESYNGENYKIDNYAFYERDDITSVVIPKGVTSIGNYAFQYCTGLTSVTIGNGVKYIGDYAFYHCDSLTSVTIGNGVTSIGSSAFNGCSKLVEVINHSSLDIQAGSSSNGYVGYYAIEVHTGESKTVNYNDYLFYTYNGVNYLLGYVGKDTALVLPESYNGENYEIYKYAFYERDDITSVVIPDSVTSIGDYAFYYCTGLTSMTIGNSVTSIGSSSFGNTAFYNDSSNWENEALYIGAYLLDVKETISGHYTIKDGTLIIAKGAFYNCTGLTSVTIPDSVTAINGVPFESCTSLTNIIVADGNTAYKSIYGNLYTKDGKMLIQYALGKTDTSFVIPDGVTSIARWAFAWCESLTSVTIGNSVISIGDHAFLRCTGLTSVTIPDSVTSIGNSAFRDCTDLTSVIIGNGVTSIGDYAFSRCTGLTSITIPDNVTSIGAYAFSGCTSLIIYCEASSKPSEWDSTWNYSDCPVVWGDGSHSHIQADAVLENQVNATCTVDGHYDSVVYCKICNYEMSRTQIIVPMSHNYIDDICVICGKLLPKTNTFEDYTEGNYIFDDMAVTKVNHIIYGANAVGETKIVVDADGNKYFEMIKSAGASSNAQTWITVERTLDVPAGTPVVFEAKMSISFTKGSFAYLRFYKDRPASTGTGGTCAGVTSLGTPTNNGTVMFNYHNGTLHIDRNSKEGYANIDLGVANGEWFTLRLVMSGKSILVQIADENGKFVDKGTINRPEWVFDLEECNGIVYMNDSNTTLSVAMDNVYFGPYVSDAGDTLL